MSDVKIREEMPKLTKVLVGLYPWIVSQLEDGATRSDSEPLFCLARNQFVRSPTVPPRRPLQPPIST